MRLWPIFLSLIGSLVVMPAQAKAPKLGGPDGAVETRSIARDLDEYPLPIAPFGGPSPIRTLKGAVTWRAWRVPADGRSVASVLQAYRETLAEQGFQTLWDCKGDDCGGFDFRFDAALLPPPAMAMDVQDFAQLSAGRTGPASFASVLVSRVGDSLFVQIVTVVPTDKSLVVKPPERPDRDANEADDGAPRPTEPLDETTGDAASAPAASEADADQKPDDGKGNEHGQADPERAEETSADKPNENTDDVEPASGTVAESGPGQNLHHGSVRSADSARRSEGEREPVDRTATVAASTSPAETANEPAADAPLLESLTTYGHVPVQGLAFETGGAALTADSAAALDAMAKMLQDNPDLRIAIVGHSDNVGPLRVNITISERRAATVRAALIERGVDGERLEARGVGYLSPRRSNASEEGRAANRRVELVLREKPKPDG